MCNMFRACSESKIIARWEDAWSSRGSKPTARSNRRDPERRKRDTWPACVSDKTLLDPRNLIPKWCSVNSKIGCILYYTKALCKSVVFKC